MVLLSLPRLLLLAEGFYALVATSGAEIKTDSGSPVWPAGFIKAGIFTRISHLVTKSFCVFDVPVKGCKTSDNVTVTIDCSIVFRIMGDADKGEDPELVRTFVHEVTPAGLEQQLKDAMAEEVRTLARSMKHTQVYTCRRGTPPVMATPPGAASGGGKAMGAIAEEGGKGESKDAGVEMVLTAEAREFSSEEEERQVGVDVTHEMEVRLNKQFNSQGVMIQDIMIQNITLPYDINDQMANKTMVKSKQQYEVMEQNFQMQEIRLKNEGDKTKLEHREAQEIAKVPALRDHGVQIGAQRHSQANSFLILLVHLHMSRLQYFPDGGAAVGAVGARCPQGAQGHPRKGPG